jgi:hypothetical protein
LRRADARRPKALPPNGDSAFFASGGDILAKKKSKVFTAFCVLLETFRIT